MSLPYERGLIDHARKLRKDATKQERRLWYDFLRNYPVRFQRQKAIGNYIVDFYCHSAKLVVEIDGSQHFEDDTKAYDQDRTHYLEQQGLKVLRFTNMDIDRHFESVCMVIMKETGEMS